MVVKERPLMVHVKHKPIVLGPLYGKFYVLNSTLASNDLEEFDPQTKTWAPLPPPPIALPKEEEQDEYKNEDGNDCFFYSSQ
ncbi:hypothetical protein RHMOL_Rhmol01G0201800 [Rhododendron molle]|uniref:Uncharacterized protein n=1 Tax=Rhododendron molle TaxID=49168 RepID=A0ACC0Q536_RHOML|nr:hypothetical protein RHMOL_Rhmol01G0201800 [Rhododendron molle]